MASVRKVRNSWQVDHYAANRQRVRKKFKTKAEAEEYAFSLDASANDRPLDLQGLLEQHRQRVSRTGEALRPGTLRTEIECARALTRLLGARTTPAALSQMDIQRYRKERQRQKATPITANKELRVLKAALRWGVAMGLLDHVPVEIRGTVSVRRDKDPETLSDAEVEVLLDHAGSPKMRALFALCRWAGLRQGEALNLQVRDIADGVIHIRAKKLEDGSEWRPKSLQRRRIPYAGAARLVDELERFERAMGPRMPTAWYLPHDSDQSKRVLDVKEAVRNTYLLSAHSYSHRDRTHPERFWRNGEYRRARGSHSEGVCALWSFV